MAGFTHPEIQRLFKRLNEKLAQKNIQGELYLVGGAVMCLLFEVRPSTKDIDALFIPATKLRPLIEQIAQEENLPRNWINDGVKGFLSQKRDFNSYLDLSHLKVFTADPKYLLAMKCLAMRLGPAFTDESDIRFLLRYLNIESYREALNIIGEYYPLKKIPQKSFYALEEILGE